MSRESVKNATQPPKYTNGGFFKKSLYICFVGTIRNTVRNIVAKAARDVGFNTDLEHGGGLGDQRRPGDIILYNWHDSKRLLIDVAVINPFCSSNVSDLMSGGVGAAATAYGKTKVRTYSDLDMSKYTFIPFIVETTGGMSKAAHGFCKELRKRRERLTFNLQPEDEKSITISDPLLIAINIELQRLNSRMVLERAPHSDNLIDADIVKCQRSIAIKRKEAIESLWLETLKPDRIIEKEKDS